MATWGAADLQKKADRDSGIGSLPEFGKNKNFEKNRFFRSLCQIIPFHPASCRVEYGVEKKNVLPIDGADVATDKGATQGETEKSVYLFFL